MQRNKTVSYKNGNASVTINIKSQTKDLTREEAEKLINNLASSSMRSLENAPYIYADLSSIKVK